MPLSIVIKFHEDQIKTVWLGERTHLWMPPAQSGFYKNTSPFKMGL